MGNLYQIIYFSTAMYNRSSHSSTIYTGVGTYIHFIFQNHNSDLRNFIVSVRGRSEAESIGADYCTRMQDTFVTDAAVMINIYIWVKKATVAYLHTVSNESMRVNLGIISDNDVFADIGEGTDIYVLANFSTGGNKSQWIDTLFLGFTHFIEIEQLRQAFISIVYFDQSSMNLMLRDKIFIN